MLLLLLIVCHVASGDVRVEVSTHDVGFRLGEQSGFGVFLRDAPDTAVQVQVFAYEGEGVVHLPENSTFTLKGNQTHYFNVTAERAGHAVLAVNSSRTDVSYVRVGVWKLSSLNVVSVVFGWIYFAAWSVSFYPQIYLNWKRKSVVGLSFDFVFLNVTGFLAYSTFNVGIYFSPIVQAEYLSLHPEGVIPVEVNDIVFGLHATFVTIVTMIQCFIYERQEQTVSYPARGVLAVIWLGALVFVVVTASGGNPHNPWLTFLYYVSYCKLAITLIKYLPQAVMNFKRKSTLGWSIGNVLLDFTGGAFSMLQMFIIAYNFEDWTSLFGNFTKFGLGAISICFDVLFIIQHYVLYRATGEYLLEGGAATSSSSSSSPAVA